MNESNPPKTISRRTLLEYWWIAPVAGVFGFFAWFLLRSYNILLGKPDPASTAAFTAGAALQVARINELEAPGAARTFEYPIKLGQNRASIPAMLIRTTEPQPGGLTVNGKHFIALSRVCTHQGCTCEYITNPEIAAIAYKFRPTKNHPVLGCACHYSAFDPEQAGRSVSGPALKPLPRFQVQVRGQTLWVVGHEAGV
jgi:Rieske Fe-S protein